MPIITAVAAALLAALHVRLSIGVIALRRERRIGIGDGEDESLARAIRAQGNSAEYVPIALILLGCLELNGGSRWLLVPLALAFLVGRVLHARGIGDATTPFRDRVLGMHLTLWPILALAALNLVQAALITLD